MASADQIRAECAQKVARATAWYHRYRAYIMRWRVRAYYKNLWLARLERYYAWLVKNYEAERDRRLARLAAEQANRKRAVIIGINYENTSHELRGCINDARNLREYLVETGNLGNDEQACYMTDGASVLPTRDNILAKYAEMLRGAQAGDKLFLTYSGHGYYTWDRSGDEADGRDELLVSIDNRAVLDDELKRITQENLKEGVTVFILLDCCHSGTLMDLRYNYLSSGDYDQPMVNSASEETKGNVYLISGCMDNQTGADAYINYTFQGAMTWAFLRAVRENPDASWKQLLTRMRSLLAPYFTQIPQLSSGRPLNVDDRVVL